MMKTITTSLNIKGNLQYFTFPKISATGITNHAFSTRLGGVSNGCFSSMNMSFNRGDDPNNVRENYKILCDAVNINPENLVFTKQTHTDNVICVTEKDRGTGFSAPSFEDIDGLVTNCRNVALVTQFADCTPLLFCDPVKKVIASSHSGWRGTVKRIGKKTVEIMKNEYSCNPTDIIAVIGPCIGKCCYEVDNAVYNEFLSAGFDNSLIFTKTKSGKFLLDLKKANEIILNEVGISSQNIDISDICTKCNSDEMFSHRAQGIHRGNMAAIIELK
ncbi:MAG: peptidoglycan editing factor PgeF [Clostridia bacterium]|nr:peptidoglycan editing factor PgeF [Clostridia bacterium]